MSNRYKVGQRIRTQDGKTGLIRYLGELDGKAGNFVGIELEEPLGKNDGSVEGRYYFDCEPDHGIFYKTISNLTILTEPRPASIASNGEDARRQSTQVVSGRPAAPGARPAVLPGGLARRQSAVAPVTSRAPRPSVGGAGLARKPSATITSSTAATSSVRPSVAGTRRISQAPAVVVPSRPVSGASRPSLAGSRMSSPTKPGTSSRLSTIGSTAAPALATARNVKSPPGRSSAGPSQASTLQSPQEDDVSFPAVDQQPTIDEVITPPPQETPPLPTAASRTAGLAEKKRLLETQQADKRRADESQKAKELEEARQRSEQIEKVNEKLQSKCRAQMEEIKKLKVALQEQESLYEQLEKTSAEHDTFMEDAILDKEMAEEREASARFDFENLRGAHDSAVEELARMKEHYEELQKDMTPEERANQGWLHMERENDRLKEALLLLRDRTTDLEADLQLQIQELETDNEELSLFRTENDENKVKLLEAQSTIEDLREQLETAEGAEGMIEQLADRNTAMSERMEHLLLTIEDLQNLKDLNDEIEESYNEQLKELEELVDARDLLVADFRARAVQQKEELDDREYTIARFRDLVVEMQGSLEEMQDSKDLTEKQAMDLESHHRSVMDFNRQLQASATSHKLKTIDLELGRMEAEQASEQLQIVQLFLPDAFLAERNSVLVLLRFKRIAFKARLLHGMVRDGIAAQGPMNGGHGEKVLLACDALDKLVWIAAMGDRFEGVISRCSLEDFAAFESTLYELEPVERTLNGFVESIRSDSLLESAMVEGLARSIAVIDHLAELHLTPTTATFADDVLMKTKIMHGQLENSAIALASAKRDLTPANQENGSEEQDMTLASTFIAKMDGVLSLTRGARGITAKVLKQLQDLNTRSMTLDARTQPSLTASAEMTHAFVDTIRSLGKILHAASHDETQTTTEIDFSRVLEAFRSFNAQNFPSSQTIENIWDPLQSSITRLHSSLSAFYNQTLDLSLTTEVDPIEPPWVQRSRLIKEMKITDRDAQEEVLQLRREAQERIRVARQTEQEVEVLKLQTEVQEAKAKESAKRVARVEQLEKLLHRGEDELDKRRTEITDLLAKITKAEAERDSWMRKAAETQPGLDGSSAANALKSLDGAAINTLLLKGDAADHLIASSTQVTALKAEIDVLHSTTRYLRQQLRRQLAIEDAKKNSWLSEPLLTASASLKEDAARHRANALRVLKRLTDVPGSVRPVVLQQQQQQQQQSLSSLLKSKKEDGSNRMDSRLGWRPVKVTPQWQVSEMERGWREALDSSSSLFLHTDGRKKGAGGYDGERYSFLKRGLGSHPGAVEIVNG